MLKYTAGSSWTLGSFIAFRNLGTYWNRKEHKTNLYEVCEGRNVKANLGHISWFPRWRKYVFEPNPNRVIFEETCLRDIAEFIEAETKSHKNTTKKKDYENT